MYGVFSTDDGKLMSRHTTFQEADDQASDHNWGASIDYVVRKLPPVFHAKKQTRRFKDDPVGYLIKRSVAVNAFSGRVAKSDGRGGWKVRPSYGRKKTSGITVVIRSTKGSKRFLVTSARAGQALIRRAAKYRNFVNGYMTR